jgi:glyoxylase-like metal-dependent hydrolase (beta-lactamase superfamily II)
MEEKDNPQAKVRAAMEDSLERRETGDTPTEMRGPLLKRLPLGALAANCYIVACPRTRQAVVVDPGAEPERILREVEALGVTVASLVHTHGHFDHIGATEAVQSGLSVPVPVAVHPADRYLYEHAARALGVMFGYPLPPKLSVPDVTLVDGEELAVGDLRLQVVHTPGHTPGSVCLLCEPWWLLSGDTLFRRGIGRTDLPGGDEDAIYESIARRLYPLAEGLIVYPGHGDETTIGEERRANPFVRG